MSVRKRNGSFETRHRINQLRERANSAEHVAQLAFFAWRKPTNTVQESARLLQLMTLEQERANHFERQADELESFTVDLT